MAKVEKCRECGSYFNADAYDECPYCGTKAGGTEEPQFDPPEDRPKDPPNPIDEGTVVPGSREDLLPIKETRPGPRKSTWKILAVIAAALCVCAAIVFAVKNASQPKLKIITQPADYTGILGDEAEFTVEATGEDLQYLWEFTDDGVEWKTSSSTGATAVCTLKEKRNGRQYRCTVSDGDGNEVVSDAATIEIKMINILEQPEDFTGPVDTDAIFTVNADGDELEYMWQFSDDGGKTWKRSSSKEATAVCPIKEERDGRLYCCVLTDQYGNVVLSNSATLTVQK